MSLLVRIDVRGATFASKRPEITRVGIRSLCTPFVRLCFMASASAAVHIASEKGKGPSISALESIPNVWAKLLSGFTTVREAGSYWALVDVAVRNAIDSNIIAGPDVGHGPVTALNRKACSIVERWFDCHCGIPGARRAI